MCVCSLSYLACKAHAPYCHLWFARFYSVFPHYLINGMIFEKKKVVQHKMCFDFLRNIFPKYFSFKKELSYMIKNVQ